MPTPTGRRGALRKIAAEYVACTLCRDLGIAEDNHRAAYSSLALAALPQRVRVLFIAESAPKLNKRGRETYFYLPEDNPDQQDCSSLFWALAEVLKLAEACGTSFQLAKESPARWKGPLLREFCSRGLWLLDSAKCAVNGLGDGRPRDNAVRQCATTWLRGEIAAVIPDHVILIKTNVFREVRPVLQSWRLGERILNDRAIPHPGSGHQEEFRMFLSALIDARPALFGLDNSGAG